MNTYHMGTKCVQGGYTPGNGEPRQVPIIQSTTFKYNTSEDMGKLFDLEASGYFYTRLQNPTNDHVAAKIAAMEGGTAAMLTSSGQAANFFAMFNICEAGDHIVASSSIYGGTFNLISVTMKKMGIDATFVSPDATEEELNAAFQPNTKLMFGETIANPALTVLDIELFAKVAHAHGVPLIVDNTFATPFLFRPLDHGADIVVHSATKFIGGHGTVMGGVVVDGGKFDWEQNDKFPGLTQPNPSYHGVVFTKACGNIAYVMKLRTTLMRDTGATLSPFHSFLLLQGLETLSLRVERHVENALKVVDFLKNHPMVKKVHHPSLAEGREKELYDKYYPNGGASIFTFELNGTKAQAQKFTESLELFSLLANVADVKSLVIHPGSTTHSQMNDEELLHAGITPTTIRLSIGTEHIDDILADLEHGFEAVKE